MKYSIGKEEFGTTPRLEQLIRKYSKGTSLDAGCGTGEYFPFFKSKEIVGTDITARYLKKINKKKFKNKKITLKLADVRKLPFPNETFDFILSAAVLEYMKNKKELNTAVKELKRVLKKNGVLVVSTPHANAFTILFRQKILTLFLEQKAEDEFFIMGRGYTKEELEMYGFSLHGCVGWVTWKNISPFLANLLDIFFWYVPFFSGSLVGIYEKK